MEDPSRLLRLAAVEVLLAEPEKLRNDALETDLYILREQMRDGAARAGEPGMTAAGLPDRDHRQQ